MLTRRHFLRRGCTASAAAATFGNSALHLALTQHASAQMAGDYRALVCILLAGGNDSYNMLIPNDDEGYSAYAAIRSDLALPREGLLALSGTDTAGRSFALHPGMAGLQSLFDGGDAALVCNVGTLLAPVDTAAIAGGNWPLPLGLFSHADQIQQWQTAVADQRIAQGWGGRLADLIEGGAGSPDGISMNISLSGNNVFQSGFQTSPYSVTTSDEGAVSLGGYDDGTPGGDFNKASIDALLEMPAIQILQEEYRGRLAGAITSQQFFSSALASAPALGTAFSNSYFSQALRQIARVISARDSLGSNRQTFFITVGGWDHHDDVLENQAAMLPMIDAGLLEFRNALLELGVPQQVTTFTTSDFGRTLTSNGKGSDHGWGGHHVVMGGAVNGGSFYGEYPDIYPDNPLDVGRGIYTPTLAVDEYFAELARWFGISAGDLDSVLPNVRTFYSPESASPPVGFMQL